jgi:hypothetical protein
VPGFRLNIGRWFKHAAGWAVYLTTEAARLSPDTRLLAIDRRSSFVAPKSGGWSEIDGCRETFWKH